LYLDLLGEKRWLEVEVRPLFMTIFDRAWVILGARQDVPGRLGCEHLVGVIPGKLSLRIKVLKHGIIGEIWADALMG